MATIKTDLELDTQTDAVVKVNGNREITPTLDNALRKNVTISKVSKKDGGLVMQADFGQLSYIAPETENSYTPKKYVDDKLVGTELDTDGVILSQTWRSQSGDYTYKLTLNDSGDFNKEEI